MNWGRGEDTVPYEFEDDQLFHFCKKVPRNFVGGVDMSKRLNL